MWYSYQCKFVLFLVFSDASNSSSHHKSFGANFERKQFFQPSTSSESGTESSSTHPSDLHGKHSNVDQRNSSSEQSESEWSKKKNRVDNITSSQLIESDQANKSDATISKSNDSLESFTKYKSKTSTKKTRTSQSSNTSYYSDSSDSMTDVSPLTSPEKSPDLKRSYKLRHSSSRNHYDDLPARHVTKLNVVFKKHGKYMNHEDHANDAVQYSSMQWSSDSDDNAINFNSSYSRQRHNHRQEAASISHRQRLLDSAARGSMDVSSLLETVLEFEKQNYRRKVCCSVLTKKNSG